MSDENKLVPPAGDDGPSSIPEQVLRLLREQSNASNHEDVLDNPQLEQLFGSLSKGLEEDIPDSALGIEPARVLTLEELAAGSQQPPEVRETAPVQPGGGAFVTCPTCGSANPGLTLFCGMCGHELGHSSTRKVSREEDEQPATIPAAAQVAAARPKGRNPSQLRKMATLISREPSQFWKMATLALLCLILGFLAAQEPWWRLQSLRKSVQSTQVSDPVFKPPLSSTPAERAPASESAVTVLQSPSADAKPPKAVPSGPLPAKPPAGKAAPTHTPSPLPAPGAASDESPVGAPAITSVAAVELPTIVKPPPSAPKLYTPPPVPRVSQIAPGSLLYKVNPQYPAAARSARVQGSVVMHAIIGADGTIQQLQLIRGNPLLVNAAMEAVKNWRYRPYLLDGKPVEVETNITVNFKGE